MPEVLRELPPAADIAAHVESDAGVPLLVIRVPALERTAWRAGMRAARGLERRVSDAFATAASRVLRAEDRIAHDRGSDAYLAVLLAPTRDGDEAVAPVDARSALARIAATVESLARIDVETGWTIREPGEPVSLAHGIERALARGARERERYTFFSALGHELRTPLSSIRGYLETLLDGGVDPRTQRRFLEIAYAESLRMSRLVEGMFEISLLDLHATFPSRSVGSLDVALDAAIDACIGTASARGVSLEAPSIPPAPVAIDGDRLTLVLINLIDNAIKHGRLGGRVGIEVDLRDRRVATIAVEDDGPGVPENDRERIFTLGQRGTTFAPGSGIGLALVRLMIERIGGRVTVGDAALGGARFALVLPRRG